MNQKMVMGRVNVIQTRHVIGRKPCRPRSLFFRARSSQGALVLSPRGDLRAVMTIETVPAEQPGTVVDELFIGVNGGDGVCGTSPLRAKSF